MAIDLLAERNNGPIDLLQNSPVETGPVGLLEPIDLLQQENQPSLMDSLKENIPRVAEAGIEGIKEYGQETFAGAMGFAKSLPGKAEEGLYALEDIGRGVLELEPRLRDDESIMLSWQKRVSKERMKQAEIAGHKAKDKLSVFGGISLAIEELAELPFKIPIGIAKTIPATIEEFQKSGMGEITKDNLLQARDFSLKRIYDRAFLEEDPKYKAGFEKVLPQEFKNLGVPLDLVTQLGMISVFAGSLNKLSSVYTAKQMNAMNKMRSLVKIEFERAGYTSEESLRGANSFLTNGMAKTKFYKRSPGELEKFVTKLERNPGKMTEFLERYKWRMDPEAGPAIGDVGTTMPATTHGPQMGINRPAGPAALGAPPVYGEAPQDYQLDTWLAGKDVLNRQVGPEYDIPLHPADAGRDAGEALEAGEAELEPTTWFGKKIKESMVDKFNIPIHDKVAFEQGMDEYMTKYGVTPWAEEGSGDIEMPIGKSSSVSYLDTEMDEPTLRIASKYPEKIINQKSLSKFTRNVEEELGVKPNMLTYKFKIVPTQSGHSGRHKRSGRDTGDILIRKGGRKASQKGSYIGMIMPPNQQLGSEGMLKKVIIHEIMHHLKPPKLGMRRRNVHHAGFKIAARDAELDVLYQTEYRYGGGMGMDIVGGETYPGEVANTPEISGGGYTGGENISGGPEDLLASETRAVPSDPTESSRSIEEAFNYMETNGSNPESGHIAIPSGEDFKQAAARACSILDIEQPFRMIGAPQTGLAVKNFMSKQIYHRERGLELIKKLNKISSRVIDNVHVMFGASQKAHTPPGLEESVKIVRKYFDDYKTELSSKGIIGDGWVDNMKNRLNNEIFQLTESLKSVKDPGRIDSISQIIDENMDALQFFEDTGTEYVHIPLRSWFESISDKNPRTIPSGLNRFFKERKTLDIRELGERLLEKGIIELKDLDIRNIIASYSDKVGRSLALSDIIENSKKEGLVRPLDQVPEGETWNEMPASVIKEFKGFVVQPTFATYLENFVKTAESSFMISHALGYAKLLTFTNPLFLLTYNVEQGIWSGSFRNIKTPLYMVKAIKSGATKDQDYWDLLEYGGFSKPYVPPYDTFKKEVEVLTAEGGFTGQAITWLKQNFAGKLGPVKGVLDTIYRPLWKLAWDYADRYPRLVTYHYFLGSGLDKSSAAQRTAMFHGDYASVPPKTRRVANRVLYTPTFKIIMGKAQLLMAQSAAKVFANAMRMKPSSKADKLKAAGLLSMIALMYARRKMMKHFGFEEEDYGLRYVKEIETEDGIKELVVYCPDAGNNILRYYHRWKTFTDDVDKMNSFINKTKWDLNPVYSTAIMMLQNKRPDGKPIYNPFDDPHEIRNDLMGFAAGNIVRVLDKALLPESSMQAKEDAYAALKNDLGQFWPLFNVISPTKLVYIREPKERTNQYRAYGIVKEFKKFASADEPETEEVAERRLANLRKMIEKFYPSE